jgi:membrane-associated protease RseP (regulator of RpoE activity)
LTVDWIPSDDRILALEDGLDGAMAIHDVATRGGGSMVVFTGQFLRSPELIYNQISERFKAIGFVPLLRQENGQDTLIAYPAPAVAGRPRKRVNLILFLITVLTTVISGTLMAVFADQTIALDTTTQLVQAVLANWTLGIPFAAALLSILGIHELGHYFVARHYRLDVSLPYFIPFIPIPPGSGTMGAVIRIQSPFESRKALFDVGIAGPLAGLAVAIPVVAVGMLQAQVAPVAADAVFFGEPLLFQWLALLFGPARGPGTDIYMNPLLMAGWWGLLITAINLIPMSQFDGGHILYGLFGPAHKWLAWGMFVIALLSFASFAISWNYVLMVAVAFLMGIEHPPALNDLTPIDLPRRILGIVTLLAFFILFTPHPL